jgi:hypothetical protein
MQKRTLAFALLAAGIPALSAMAADIVTKPRAGNATTLSDPVTQDTVVLLTHANGTYVKHANGLAGYIVPRPKDPAPPDDPVAQHAYYVRAYEVLGYVKVK